MIPLRIHYLILGGVRCGVRPQNWTIDPKQVTCKTCKRLMEGDMK